MNVCDGGAPRSTCQYYAKTRRGRAGAARQLLIDGEVGLHQKAARRVALPGGHEANLLPAIPHSNEVLLLSAQIVATSPTLLPVRVSSCACPLCLCFDHV